MITRALCKSVINLSTIYCTAKFSQVFVLCPVIDLPADLALATSPPPMPRHLGMPTEWGDKIRGNSTTHVRKIPKVGENKKSTQLLLFILFIINPTSLFSSIHLVSTLRISSSQILYTTVYSFQYGRRVYPATRISWPCSHFDHL